MGLLRALSFSLLALCIAGFGAWLIYAATDSYAVDDTTQLENGLAFSDLEGTQVFTMLLTWLPLLLGTLLTLALRRLVAGAPAQGRRSFWAKVRAGGRPAVVERRCWMLGSVPGVGLSKGE